MHAGTQVDDLLLLQSVKPVIKNACLMQDSRKGLWDYESVLVNMESGGGESKRHAH